MAKKRRSSSKRVVYRTTSSRPAKRRRSSRNSGSNDLTKMMLGGAIYGGVRQKVSNLLMPVTSKVPFGNISDELVLGVIHYYGAKKVKNPLLKSVFRAGLIIESARVGEAVADGSIMGNNIPKITGVSVF